jgi:uncharacterized protein
MEIANNFSMLINQIQGMFYYSVINRLLILTCSAQVASMLAKMIINSFKSKKLTADNIANYGGMPSSHTVFAMSFVFGVVLDKNLGFGSPFFVVSLVFAAIMMMDAVRLRGAVDKVNDAVRVITESNPELKDKINLPKHVAHSTAEVIGGIIFAFLYTFIFYLFFYNFFK